MNFTQLKSVLPYALKIGRTPHIIGHAGIGKSSIVYQVFQEMGYNVVERRLGQMADAGDLIGLMEFIKNKDNVNTHVDYVLPKWFPREPKTVIFLDEVNRAHKDLLQAIFELVYDKSLMGNKLPEDCHIVAASNPPTGDYQVLDFNDTAFQDRFIHIKFEPTLEEFITYGKSRNLSNTVLDFISENPKLLENTELEDFSLDFVKPSRRSWEAVAKLDELNMEKALFVETIMGIVGSHAAIAFSSYKENYVKNISAKDVLYNYDKIKHDLKVILDKNQNDKVSDLISNVIHDLKKLETLPKVVQNSILSFTTDLTDEFAFTFMQALMTLPCLAHAEGMPMGAFADLDYWGERIAPIIKAKKEAQKKADSKAKQDKK